MGKIVIVEDDVFLREELQNIVEKEGYAVECISSFHAPLEQIVAASPILILLDLNLPNLSGFDICRELKAKGIGPILVLTSRNQMRDELHALEIGADDYVTKPCHPKRLLARMKKLLQLYSNRQVLLDAGDFQLDEQTNILYVDQQAILIADNEAMILKTLIKAAPTVVAKEELFLRLWGSSEYVDENILQVNIARVRKTLGNIGRPNRIKTIRGVGYQFVKGERM